MVEQGGSWEPVMDVSAFQFPAWPVLCSDSPQKMVWGRWGLVPHWVKDEAKAKDIRSKTPNARVETLAEKPSFRDCLDRRCLVPVTGFFEPHHRGKEVYPYLFTRKDRELFALAGIFQESSWVKGGRGFSILTIDADEETARIHNRKKRMPLIIPQEGWTQWLDPSEPMDQWQHWAQAPRELDHWPITREFYKPKRSVEGLELLKPQYYSELESTLGQQMDLF